MRQSGFGQMGGDGFGDMFRKKSKGERNREAKNDLRDHERRTRERMRGKSDEARERIERRAKKKTERLQAEIDKTTVRSGFDHVNSDAREARLAGERDMHAERYDDEAMSGNVVVSGTERARNTQVDVRDLPEGLFYKDLKVYDNPDHYGGVWTSDPEYKIARQSALRAQVERYEENSHRLRDALDKDNFANNIKYDIPFAQVDLSSNPDRQLARNGIEQVVGQLTLRAGNVVPFKINVFVEPFDGADTYELVIPKFVVKSKDTVPETSMDEDNEVTPGGDWEGLPPETVVEGSTRATYKNIADLRNHLVKDVKGGYVGYVPSYTNQTVKGRAEMASFGDGRQSVINSSVTEGRDEPGTVTAQTDRVEASGDEAPESDNTPGVESFDVVYMKDGDEESYPVTAYAKKEGNRTVYSLEFEDGTYDQLTKRELKRTMADRFGIDSRHVQLKKVDEEQG